MHRFIFNAFYKSSLNRIVHCVHLAFRVCLFWLWCDVNEEKADRKLINSVLCSRSRLFLCSADGFKNTMQCDYFLKHLQIYKQAKSRLNDKLNLLINLNNSKGPMGALSHKRVFSFEITALIYGPAITHRLSHVMSTLENK